MSNFEEMFEISIKNIKLLECEQIIYHFKARHLKIPNIFFAKYLNFSI